MNKIDLTTQVIEPFERINRLYQELEQTTDTYGTDELLHPSEIHTVEEIGHHPKTSLTDLAEYLRITKGSATKMVQRLVKKALVTKTFAPDSENKIQIILTSKGEIAYKNHRQYLQHLENQLISIYEPLSDQELEGIIRISQPTEDLLKRLIQERSR
ncbi:MarR family transcriptional regulator [Oenococcus sicerae]|uniref:MarR family transcriptional regulator n=1 Tax=Oenococcus sicerae TaxID=2203724 RepID=A0AAJ1RC73_9LACO|nr:MarR family transcriptional regulator [Oenococcus sicerae]MDN6900072.1 MarR family transcriptional regulator [Oenococcus sicerae]QAS69681.1 MarR family transcriptional regulator [Oenococcus sicerae]